MPSTCAIFDDVEKIVPDEARTHAGFRAWVKSHACPKRARVTFERGVASLLACASGSCAEESGTLI